MCGRYALALSNEEVYDSLESQLPRIFRRQARGHGGEGGEGSGGGEGSRARWERPQDYRGSYNVAPRSRAPVIRRDSDNEERAMIETMQWGLVPHWTKHPPSGPLNTINARSEALLDPSSGGMWHALKAYKRCIVPAQGYYEWLKKPSTKIAHFTRLPLSSKEDDNLHPPLIFFAGLWDTVKYLSPVESKYKPKPNPIINVDVDESPASSSSMSERREAYPTGNPIPLSTFTILTTVPTKDISWLHDRMPCILSTEEDIINWLDLGTVKGWSDGKDGTAKLLHGQSGLDCFPVPPEVGKIGTNSPTYIQPVSERSDGIKSFFQKQAPSPAKPKSKVKPAVKSESEQHPSKPAVKDEDEDNGPTPEHHDPHVGNSKTKNDTSNEAGEIKSEITPKDEEKGLGDDSNAPNPATDTHTDASEIEVADEMGDTTKSTPIHTPEKRKRATNTEDEEEGKSEAEPPKKGGRQTKVVRKAEQPKAQPAITNFFKSPRTATTRGGSKFKPK